MNHSEKSSEAERIMAIINGFEEEGKALGKKEAAKEMLNEGFSSIRIAKLTGLDSLEIIKLMELPNSYRKKGNKLAKEEIAMQMIKERLDHQLISKVTWLELEKIARLKKQL